MKGPSDADADRVAGLLKGFVLGDALAAATSGATGMLRISVASQLLVVSVDAFIRARVRDADRGILADRAVLQWFALRRWARWQELPIASDPEHDALTAPKWDNWLARVPALTQRRGSAPATANALATGWHQGNGLRRVSTGSHVIARILPFGALTALPQQRFLLAAAHEVALQTHAEPAADVAVSTARLLAAVWLSRNVIEGAQLLIAMGSDVDGLITRVVAPWELTGAAQTSTAADANTAAGALAVGLTLALDLERDVQSGRVLAGAETSLSSGVASGLAFALLGAAYGETVLPSDLLKRVEIAEEVEGLTHDFAVVLDLPDATQFKRSYPPV
jgi:ADP-ribosylglycohydrolase